MNSNGLLTKQQALQLCKENIEKCLLEANIDRVKSCHDCCDHSCHNCWLDEWTYWETACLIIADMFDSTVFGLDGHRLVAEGGHWSELIWNSAIEREVRKKIRARVRREADVTKIKSHIEAIFLDSANIIPLSIAFTLGIWAFCFLVVFVFPVMRFFKE